MSSIVDVLKEALKDNSPVVSQAAVEALRQVGGEEAMDASFAHLASGLRATENAQRIAAIDKLASLGGERVKAALRDLLSDHHDAVRTAALKALCLKLDGFKDEDLLQKAARSNDEELQRAALNVLVKRRDVESIKRMPRPNYIRQPLLDAFKSLGAMEEVAGFLYSNGVGRALEVVETLKAMGIVEPLMEAVKRHPEAPVRAAIIKALGEISARTQGKAPSKAEAA